MQAGGVGGRVDGAGHYRFAVVDVDFQRGGVGVDAQAVQLREREAADVAAFAGHVFFWFGQRAALAAVEDERFAVVGQHGFGGGAGTQGEDEGAALRVGEVEFVVDAVVGACAAQLVERGQWPLAQLAVFNGQHARQGEAVRPAVARAGAASVGQSHPADEQAFAVRAKTALRRVVVKAVVEFAEAVVREAAGGFVEGTEEVAGLVEVAAAVAVGGQALRAAEEDVAPVEREVVGAFPHIAEVIVGFYAVYIVPVI
mgnify:CR=1 FL=1